MEIYTTEVIINIKLDTFSITENPMPTSVRFYRIMDLPFNPFIAKGQLLELDKICELKVTWVKWWETRARISETKKTESSLPAYTIWAVGTIGKDYNFHYIVEGLKNDPRYKERSESEWL